MASPQHSAARNEAYQALLRLQASNPQELFELRGTIQGLIESATYPRLTVGVQQDEDGNTVKVLLDPDGEEVTPDRLTAVDVSERWTTADDLDVDAKKVTFVYDDIGDFDGLVYMLDEQTAVDLPDGWTKV